MIKKNTKTNEILKAELVKKIKVPRTLKLKE